MKRQAYQRPELRDANDNIIQEGTYGKESPLVNSDNTGVLDYINNNLEALRDNINAGITAALQKVYPVGSIYTSLTDSRNPNAILGFGTWEALPPGYTLIAQGSGSDSFGSFTYTAGQKYGERMHKLTTDEMPNHKHDSTIDDSLSIVNDAYKDTWYKATHWSNNYRFVDNNIKPNGGNQPHNTLPPSIAAYGWRRTA